MQCACMLFVVAPVLRCADWRGPNWWLQGWRFNR